MFEVSGTTWTRLRNWFEASLLTITAGRFFLTSPPPRAVRRRREPRRSSKARARVIPEKVQPPERPHRDEILRHLVAGSDDEEEQHGNEGAAPVALLHAHSLQRHTREEAVLNEVPLLRRRLVPVHGEEQKHVHARSEERRVG